MRGRTPTLHCDHGEGDCGDWDADDYELNVNSVNGVRITQSHRALGWFSTDMDEDYCPKHIPAPCAPTTKETTP